MIDDDLLKSARKKSRELAKAKQAVDEFLKVKNHSGIEALPLFKKAAGELHRVSHENLLVERLEEECEKLDKRTVETLQRRREELHKLAAEAGWAARRLQDFDFIGCFRLDYRREQVTVKLGSERCNSFNETDGKKVFVRLQQELSKLQSFPFSRDDFFQMVKEALLIGRVFGYDNDGKMPIRKVYASCVLARQTRNEKFLQNPNGKNFRDYSICQFIFDMARFGQSGWYGGRGERLSSQTPNMSSAVEKKTLTLPSLDGAETGAQLAALWIGKA